MGSGEQDAYPAPSELRPAFEVSDVFEDGERMLYVGDATSSTADVKATVADVFDEDYTVEVRRDYRGDGELPDFEDELVIVAEPEAVRLLPWNVPWGKLLTVVSLVFTLLATLGAGLTWYDKSEESLWVLLEVLPYAISVIGVLGIHELGHYAACKYHDVDASWPVFIPFPFFIGTIGGYVDIKDEIPDRKALFDVGIAGPIAGMVAAIVVAVIGFQLDPVTHANANEPRTLWISFIDPPFLEWIGDAIHLATGTQTEYPEHGVTRNPVVLGAWIGTFVTLLNILPVGQLDGGHMSRALVGEQPAKWLGALVPVSLAGLAGWMFISGNESMARFWGFWALFVGYYWYKGTADPLAETGEIGRRRVALAGVVFVLGLLCFTPTPIEVNTIQPAVP
jgi:Zn-dependent protease